MSNPGASDVGGDWCVTEKIHGANFSIHVERSRACGSGFRGLVVEMP